MKGGYEKIVPLYNEPKNSPFIPNIQKQIYNEKLLEKGILPDQNNRDVSGDKSSAPKGNPLVNLQVYQPAKPRQETKPGPTFFAQPIAPTPYVPPQFAYQMPPYLYNGNVNYQTATGQVTLPVVNTYNINIDGVNGDPGKLSMIYEDMMPMQNGRALGTMTTIGERLSIHNYV